MSELTEKARHLAQSVRRDDVAVDLLAQAVEALCDELEAHQHSYVGPRGAGGGLWYTTLPQMDTEAAAHQRFLKAQADKKKDRIKPRHYTDEDHQAWVDYE